MDRTVDVILADMSAITDGAENRNLSDDEIKRYTALEAELETVKASVEAKKRDAAYRTPVPGPPAPVTAILNTTDEELRGFEHYIRTGQINQDLEFRAQTEGSTTAGGFLVPPGFRQVLIERLKEYGGLAAQATTIDTGSGNPLQWPTVDDTGHMGEIVAEGGTFAAGADITFGTATLGAFRYAAGGAGNVPLQISYELLQDSAFDVMAYITRAFAVRLGRVQAAHWVNGTGSGEPLGITYGLTGVMPAANTGITYPDLVTFIHSLDPAYRGNAKWCFNDASLAYFRSLVDDDKRPLWLPEAESGMGAMPGGSLLGYPVVIDQAFADIDVDDKTVIWGVFGDIAQSYVIRRVAEITFKVFDEVYAMNGLIGFMAWARADGTVQSPNSYVAIGGKS